MRKNFLILMLLTLLPLSGFATDNITATLSDDLSKTYDGHPTTISDLITSMQSGTTNYEGLVSYTVNGEAATTIPAEAGTYEVAIVLPDGDHWAAEDANSTFEYTVVKKQIVYFLTGSTYAIGDKPVVTNHYSLANGAFVPGEALEDYASFAFATSGNDALDLDKDGRFTTITTYNITALRIVEKNVHQNYDFRFTSTAAIVVTAKSIAAFLSDAVADQKYTGSKIEPEAPAIYASVEDQNANPKIALDKSNYDVTYVPVSEANQNRDNINVAKGGVIVYTGKGNYEGTLEIPFNITARPLNSVTVGAVVNQTYAYGEEITPDLIVTGKGDDNNDYPLTLTTDYTVNYNNTNKNVSAEGATGTLELVANGNFSLATNAQVAQAKFMIVPKNLGDDDIAIANIDAQDYTAAAIEPVPTAVNWTINQVAKDIKEYVEYEYENNEAVGTATIIAKPKTTNDPQNYTGQAQKTFSILPTSLTAGNVTIEFKQVNPNNAEELLDKTFSYLGREIKPGTTDGDGVLLVKDGDAVLELGKDYAIDSYGDDTHDNTNAGNNKGLVTIKGIGNYGKIDNLGNPITKSQTFNIEKADVTVTATTGVNTTFGVEPTLSATIGTQNDESIGGQLDYIVEVKNGQNWEDYNGALTALAVGTEYRYKAKWTATGLEPEQDPDADVTYSTQDQINARDNYAITLDQNNVCTSFDYTYGTITVNNAKWIIVPDDQEKKYGVADAAIWPAESKKYKVYNGTVAEANLVAVPEFNEGHYPVIGRKPIVNATHNDGEDVVNGGYIISVLNETGDNAVAKTGYTIECQTGTLTIVPFEITLTANDQTIFYGDEPNTETTDEDYVKNGAGNGTKLTVTFEPVMLANGNLIKRTGEDGLGLSLAWNEDGTIGSHTDALVPSISNPNFKVVATNKGKVTVEQNDEIILNRVAKADFDKPTINTAASLIENYNGKDVTVGFSDFNMLPEKWYPLVLPFATDVATISQKFGYAIVNILSENQPDIAEGKVNLKLHMQEIAAGQPFVVKIYKERNMNTVTFQGVHIDNAEPIDEQEGVSFIGSYTGRTDGFRSNQLYFSATAGYNQYYTGNATNTTYLRPLGAYFELTNGQQAREIIFEEANGSTTAIKVVNTENNASGEGWYNLNGMKLENAPAQKGVYIQNGKKFVVK